jgi:acyl carrier protein
MTDQEVFEKISAILTQDFRVPAAKISGTATFRGTFGMDSLDAVDFIYLVTKAFGLKADVADFRELDNLDKVVAYLGKAVRAKEAKGA